MAEEEKKPGGADNKKKKFYRRFAKGATGRGSTYKSKVQGLENNTFDVGVSSNPAKFSKLLKNIENYIQKTYKDPDDMVKTIQKMKRVILKYPGIQRRQMQRAAMPTETQIQTCLGWPHSCGKKTTSR